VLQIVKTVISKTRLTESAEIAIKVAQHAKIAKLAQFAKKD
jgi:hypothetical protein